MLKLSISLQKSSVSLGMILASIDFAVLLSSWLPHLYIETLRNFQNSTINQRL